MRDDRLIELPDGWELVRTTSEFDESTTPAGLQRAHRVAEGVWGRLVVRSGGLRFGFDDVDDVDESSEWELRSGDSQMIPPSRPHHVTVDRPVRFVVEFHRARLP